jgi:hypothetical protein
MLRLYKSKKPWSCQPSNIAGAFFDVPKNGISGAVAIG